jgi:hypothetical protein
MWQIFDLELQKDSAGIQEFWKQALSNLKKV